MKTNQILALMNDLHATVQAALGREVYHGILHSSQIDHLAAEFSAALEIPTDEIQLGDGGTSFREQYRGAVRLHYKPETPVHEWLPERNRIRRALERWRLTRFDEDLVHFYMVTTKPFLNDALNTNNLAVALTIPIYFVMVIDEDTEE